MKFPIWLAACLIGALVGVAAWASIKHFAYTNIGWTAWLIAALVGLGAWVVAPTGIRGSEAVASDPAARAELKVRRRKCRRRRVLVAIGIVVAMIGGLAVRLRLGMLPHVDYTAKLTELYQQQLPPSARGPGVPNEWPKLQRVLDQVADLDLQIGVVNRWGGLWCDSFTTTSRITYPQEPAKQRIQRPTTLAAYEDAGIFDAMSDAVACPKLLMPFEPSAAARATHYVKLRPLSQVMSALSYAVHSAIARGDPEEAIRRLELFVALGRVLELQPTILEQCLVQQCRSLIARGITRSVPAPGLCPASLLSLLDALRRNERWRSHAYVVECQRLGSSSLIQSVYHDSGDSQVAPRWLQPVLLSVIHTQAQQQQVLDDICAATAALDGLLYANHAAADDAFIRRIEKMGIFDAPVKVLISPIPTVGVLATRSDCEVAGAILILAIELHRARHDGRPPDSLDALIPGELAELPRDPFAPDGCFIYRSLADVPGTVGPPYVLYSVGADQRDDGGLMPMTWNEDQGRALESRSLDEGPCDHIFTALSQEGWAIRLDERPSARAPHR